MRTPVAVLVVAACLLGAAVARAQAPAFDAASVPETRAPLPPFPFFQAPQGLTGKVEPARLERKFDRAHVVANEAVIPVEGRIWYQRYPLQGAGRSYTALEFHRNYADAVQRLGGAEVSRAQYTPKLLQAAGGRAAVDRHYFGACATHSCENHTYLLRQGGNEYWVQVSTGGIPLHGGVMVLQRQAMDSSLAFLDARAMKQQLDARGRVALYVNFDTDRATLRPDAAPVVSEIVTLLATHPELKVSIEGHTDATGTAERNRELSKQRADTVVRALGMFGIAQERLAARGFGSDKPLAPEKDDAARAKNRRVELVRR